MSARPEERAPNPEEYAALASWAELGFRILDHCGDQASPHSLPDDLDKTYVAWIEDGTNEKPSQGELCRGLGALLGECLTEDLDYEWTMVLDDDDWEYSVRHADGWQSFPFDFVAKRIRENETAGGFFRALYDLLDKRPEE